MGPAEHALAVVLGSSAHLWHNRPGRAAGAKWMPFRVGKDQPAARLAAGLYVPAAIELYGHLLSIWKLNADLMAHLASYALVESDWRDLKIACAALMLVQSRAGAPVRDDDGTVAFFDDDYRVIGEAMVLWYKKQSLRMLTPKGVIRIAELLETPEIAALNRAAGFGDPASKRPPLGRWAKAATKWLAIREANAPMLQGLVRAGYGKLIQRLARKVGYKPRSAHFFQVLGWKQAQADGGHRTIGLDNVGLAKQERFDGLSEAEICETIVSQKLRYKDAIGRLPADVGLTPAIMVALLPSLSDADLRQLTPTLEELGLFAAAEIRTRWEQAIAAATDQRGANIAKNVRSAALREKLVESADNAAKAAVAAATEAADVRVMFLVDKSGSMQGAIETSKLVLGKILGGFPLAKLHVAAFDTVGQVLVPKAASRVAVEHMLAPIRAEGGTVHGSGVAALHRAGMRVPAGSQLVVIVVGDSVGEQGSTFATSFHMYGYTVSAFAFIDASNANGQVGSTVRDAAAALGLPYSEVKADVFDDPYHVTRVLQALLEAPPPSAVRTAGFVDKVMATKLLEL
ncbi:MAG TPA: hypothetical protein VGM88_06225 [Kofleriaceae bacterium]